MRRSTSSRLHAVRRSIAIGTAATLCAAALSSVATPAASAADQPWRNPDQSATARAQELLAAMTLADKVHMLHGVDSSLAPVDTVGYIPPIRRLGVPAITMTDGPAGVRNGRRSTEMPAPISEAASFDTSIAHAYGKVVGGDARDLGQDQLFGPGMNIDRVPTNGRNFEYFSEDPVLSGTIAGANVRGVQSQGTIATIKHFVANNDETNRMSISADIGDRALHEIYEKNFGIAVAEGHPGSVMCSYNRINDVYACSNASTLTAALRKQFDFGGYVVSDYPATHATTDVAAGLNVELPVGVFLTLPLVKAALAAGTISMADIDQRVLETLTVLFRFGIFDRALTTTPIDQKSDDAVAERVDAQSSVLLKDAHDVLPISAGTKRIAVIGATAKTSAQGGGSSQVDPLSVDNAYDAIVSRAGSGRSVSYDDGADPTTAAAAAKAAQLAIVFVSDSSSEGSDRSTLALSGNQDAVVSAVAAANPNTVVVLETGAPALLPWLSDVRGVLEAWYPGARGGAAIASLLFGDQNPSGKLPQTWPRSDAQVPASSPRQYPGVNGEEHYSEGIDVGYRWYDANHKTPLFPFGYGLSYTKFRYSNLTLSRATGTSANNVKVSFDVQNVGSRAGREAAQVYVSKPDTLVTSPPRELAAFGKVYLTPGETKRMTMTVERRDLAYWDTGAQAFTVQDGRYTMAAGSSSRDLPLHAAYRVTSSDGPVRLTTDAAGPDVRAPGSSFVLSTTLSNASDVTDRDATLSVDLPKHWSVDPIDSTHFSRIGPGGSVTSRFRVHVAADATGGPYTYSATATGSVDGQAITSTRESSLTVPFTSFDAAKDTVGLTHNSDPGPGDFDPGGYSYSAENLAAVGITPGGHLTVQGSTVTFPGDEPGTPDAVTAHGQVIEVGTSTAHLVFLGAATSGTADTSVTVTYTDGSTQSVPLQFADWYSDAAIGTSTVVATSEWNQPPNGIGAHDVAIYGQVSSVDPSKTIATITLPTVPNLHLFTAGPENA